MAFEVKTEKGRTTALQDMNIRKINEADGIAVVVRSVDDVKNVIREWRHEYDGKRILRWDCRA